MSRSKAKGTSWETELVPRLRLLFGPQVDRAPLRGTADAGDFVGCADLLVEAKSTMVPKFLEWARTATKKNGGRWVVAWHGDRRKPGQGPYVLLPLDLWEELAEAWVDRQRKPNDAGLPEFLRQRGVVQPTGGFISNSPVVRMEQPPQWPKPDHRLFVADI